MSYQDEINKRFCTIGCGQSVRKGEIKCDKCKENPMWSIIETYGQTYESDKNKGKGLGKSG